MFDKEIRLETKRLIIRPFTAGDQVAIFNMMKDKEMYTYTPDDPWESIETAGEFLKLVFWLYDLDHVTFRHFFAVTEKESGTMVGFCGVGGIDYDRSSNELFYHIGKDSWGKGYATESSEAMLKYYFEQLGLEKVIGAVHPDNIASSRVMEKLGFASAGTISGLPEEHSYYNGEKLYTMTKAEYMTKYKQL